MSDINFKIKKALIYIKNNLIEFEDNMYSHVDSSININNVITGFKNITLRKANVKRYWYDKMYLATTTEFEPTTT